MQPSTRSLLTLALLGAAASAQASEFTLFIYETPQALAKRNNPADASAYWDGYNQFAGAMVGAGILRGGSALSPASITVRNNDHPQSFKGAVLSGYFIIDVADLDAARHWAQQAPASAVAIEVRSHQANPTMAAR